MIKFDLQVDIYRPLTMVFSFIASPENDFHWQYGTLMSAQISKGEIGVGGLFRAVGHFMGRRMESVYEVTEFESNKKYGFRSRPGSIESHTLYTFEVIRYSTRVHVFAQIEPGSAWMTRESTMAKMLKKQFRENLALLKDVLETGPADTIVDDISVVPGRQT